MIRRDGFFGSHATLLLAVFCAVSVLAATSAAEPQWLVPEGEPDANQWFAYRNSFVVSEVPDLVMAKIACDSKYWVIYTVEKEIVTVKVIDINAHNY